MWPYGWIEGMRRWPCYTRGKAESRQRRNVHVKTSLTSLAIMGSVYAMKEISNGCGWPIVSGATYGGNRLRIALSSPQLPAQLAVRLLHIFDAFERIEHHATWLECEILVCPNSLPHFDRDACNDRHLAIVECGTCLISLLNLSLVSPSKLLQTSEIVVCDVKCKLCLSVFDDFNSCLRDQFSIDRMFVPALFSTQLWLVRKSAAW